MKQQKGITLMSLVIYVAVMLVIIGIMSAITTDFSKNMDTVQGNVQEIVEFSKFNNYFLKEVKTTNNKVDHISEDNTYILFTTGNSFSILDNKIYFNKIKICEQVQEMQITFGQNGDEVDKSIVNVTLNFKNFNKSISYKMEDIY